MTETGDLVQLARDRDLCIQYLDKQLTSSGLCHPSTVDSGKEVEITSDSQFGISPFYIPKGKPVYYVQIIAIMFQNTIKRDQNMTLHMHA